MKIPIPPGSKRSRKFVNKLNKMKLGGHFHRISRPVKTYPKCTKTNKIYDTAFTPTTDPLQNDVFTETRKSLPKPKNFLQIPQKCHHHRTSTKTPKNPSNPPKPDRNTYNPTKPTKQAKELTKRSKTLRNPPNQPKHLESHQTHQNT